MMKNQPAVANTDMETGPITQALYPKMFEPELIWWSFIPSSPYTLCLVFYYWHCHPVNYVLLVISGISLPFVDGLACADLATGNVILEAGILSIVMAVSLTLFTFWAAKRGYHYTFFGPFLLGSMMVILIFGLIQIFFPLGKISVMIYGCFPAIIFCACLAYKTDFLIKLYTYDKNAYAVWLCITVVDIQRFLV
ncbi:protein LIFEGUARD 4-like [Bidens hawaiensis]|uniref:protein LIFEGUARD 4-like n=1 Tax=Bidens hawaiensis TaxID=980011 RepID=UPI00404B7B04